MHSVWTVYTLFITVNIVSQSQQMRAKKKKKKSRKRELKNVDAEPKHILYAQWSILRVKKIVYASGAWDQYLTDRWVLQTFQLQSFLLNMR